MAAIQPDTAVKLVRLASRLAEPQEDTAICVLTVQKVPPNLSEEKVKELIQSSKAKRSNLLDLTAPIAQARNVPIYTKLKVASNVESAIYNEINSPNPVRMVLLGWPSSKEKLGIPHNILKEVMVSAQKDVGVLRDVGINHLKNILIPVGTGPNARLALELASYLARPGWYPGDRPAADAPWPG